MTVIYGIKNCDTMKKAKAWLDANQKPYQFHDYRKDGIEKEWLTSIVDQLGWEALLNKRGTTYRALDEETKANIDQASAIELMLQHPAMIKRPLLDTGSKKILGFKADDYAAVFQS